MFLLYQPVVDATAVSAAAAVVDAAAVVVGTAAAVVDAAAVVVGTAAAVVDAATTDAVYPSFFNRCTAK